MCAPFFGACEFRLPMHALPTVRPLCLKVVGRKRFLKYGCRAMRHGMRGGDQLPTPHEWAQCAWRTLCL